MFKNRRKQIDRVRSQFGGYPRRVVLKGGMKGGFGRRWGWAVSQSGCCSLEKVIWDVDLWRVYLFACWTFIEHLERRRKRREKRKKRRERRWGGGGRNHNTQSSRRWDQFTCPPAAQKSSCCYTFLPTLGCMRLRFCPSEVRNDTYCGVNLHFLIAS